ncbi:hypothetical protein BSFA1_48620 [Burkholderia sp. SFA1]|nr:hypothetical protein BSFA1_48620 [Burkholderia sp. SFA1]
MGVDDAHFHAVAAQFGGEHQADGARTGNQHICRIEHDAISPEETVESLGGAACATLRDRQNNAFGAACARCANRLAL